MFDEPTENSKSVVPLNNTRIPNILTALPVYKQPVFPGIMVPISIPHENLIPDLDKELKTGQFIGFFLVKKEFDKIPIDEITPKMIYSLGGVARIVKRIYMPNGSVNIMVNCFNRIEIIDVIETQPIIKVEVEHIKEKEQKQDLESKVLINTIGEQMDFLGKTNPILAEQIKIAIQNADSYSRAADFIASIITDVEKNRLQEILETISVRIRLEKIAILLEEKLSVMRLQEKILEQINQKTEKQQRDFFLREQLKAIQEELGINSDPKAQEIQKFLARFEEIKETLEEEVKEKLQSELDKIQTMDPRAAEYTVTVNYLDTALALPWNHSVTESVSLKYAGRILDDRHYGLDDVKTRILEFLAVHKLKKDTRGTVICFVGPPGVGKTSLGKAIADSLQRPFFRFSVGGMRDEAEIKGHRRTYIGAMPGKILQGLKSLKAKNPVFMIDEIDKIGGSHQGDPSSALLEVLDPEQNRNFRDHYLDLPFDISEVLFITTANSLSTIPAPLLDRMEIIQLSGYIPEEKYMIGKNYILEKQLLKNGLQADEFTLTKKAYLYIAEKYSRESGIRNFEQQIEKLCRKIAFRKVNAEEFPTKIDAEDLNQFLGPEIFAQDEKKRIRQPGISIGLAWTSMGGDTLYIESILIPSRNGSLKMTGQLGDVMQESAGIAYSFLQSVGKKLKLNSKILGENTIHIHVPAGAVPKDGPSAGITMATAMYSLLSGKKVPQNYAMTGELTLTGSILPIGGLKEKSIAAVRAGISNIIMPFDNKKDIDEIPEIVKKHLTYYPVQTFEEVLKVLFNGE